MKKKSKLIILALIILIVDSCKLFSLFPIAKKSEIGGLSASVIYNGNPVSDKGIRTIRPTLNFELAGFDWTLTGPSGEVKEYKNAQSINDNNLSTGVWNVKIIGKNAAGVTVAAGSKDVTIQPVVTTNAAIDIEILQGKGRLRLELSWPVGVLVKPEIVAVLEKVNAEQDGSIVYGDPIDLGFSMTLGNTGAIYEGADIESGYYVASIRLLESGETTWGIREAVYIFKDETSAKNYILPGSSLKSRPKAPSAFIIRNYGTSGDGNPEIELAWNDESDNEALFVLERKIDGEDEFTVLNEEIAMNATRYVDSNLDKSKIYHYRLAAKNMWGRSEYTDIVSTSFPDTVDVTENIAADQSWTNTNAYVIKGQLSLLKGVTLTIDPGTIVKFADGASLDVYGTLLADGAKPDDSATIRFSPLKLDAAQGSWIGMTFHGTSASGSVLKNISLTSGRTLKFDDAYPLIDGVAVKNFRSQYSWDDGDENRSVVSFFVVNGIGSETSPYTIKNLKIDNTTFGARIDIAASATGAIKFKELDIMNAVNRALRVTNSSPSLALSIQDSSFKSSSTGVILDGSNSTTILERCTIEGNSTGVSIGNFGNVPQNGTLKDSKIRMNNTGVYVYTRDCQSSTFKIQGNSIANNNGFSVNAFTGSNGLLLNGNDFMSNSDSVYLNGSALTSVDSNTFQGTSNGREMLVNGGIGINEAYNYWGTSDVALIKMKIHDKLDDSSLGEVKFQPFFTKPSLYLKPSYPISGEIVKDYLFDFSWTSYRKPGSVDFILARDAAMTDVIHTVRGDLGSSYQLPNDVRDSLVEKTQYYWKVGSVDENGDVAYGGVNSFVMSEQGIGIDIIQFEEAVSIEDLSGTLFRGKSYSARAASTKKPDKYRWTLGSELLQEGTSNLCPIDTSILGSGNYLLTVKAYFGQRHTSATRAFKIENLKVSAAWSPSLGMVARLSDGTTQAWGSGIWRGNGELNSLSKIEVNYGDILDYQVRQGCHFWLRQDGTLWAAGNNYDGQLGIGQANGYIDTPRQVAKSVKSFSIGGQGITNMFGLLVKEDGSVYSWGYNNNGQLGINSRTNMSSPTKVELPGPVSAVSAGYIHSLALLQDGSVFGWGNNSSWPLGVKPNDAISDDYLVPAKIPGLPQINAIHAGYFLSYFIDSASKLKALGSCQYGNLGTGTNWSSYSTPVAITLGDSVAKIINMEYCTFALTESGSLYSWGRNFEGVLGLGYANEVYQFTPKLLAEKVNDFGVGRYHAWYLDMDGVLWLWGDNGNWQQGVSDTMVNQISPAVVNW